MPHSICTSTCILCRTHTRTRARHLCYIPHTQHTFIPLLHSIPVYYARRETLTHLTRTFKHVAFVPGNHDLWATQSPGACSTESSGGGRSRSSSSTHTNGVRPTSLDRFNELQSLCKLRGSPPLLSVYMANGVSVNRGLGQSPVLVYLPQMTLCNTNPHPSRTFIRHFLLKKSLLLVCIQFH